MAGTPPDDSPTNHTGDGASRKFALRLTDSASRYAARHGLESELGKIELGPECQAGDLVSLETSSRPHDFIIHSRRWVISNAGRQLEITLDHPVRRSRA